MVASEEGDSVFVLDFEEEDVEEGLDAVKSAVDVVAHEEIVGALDRKRSTGSFPQI